MFSRSLFDTCCHCSISCNSRPQPMQTSFSSRQQLRIHGDSTEGLADGLRSKFIVGERRREAAKTAMRRSVAKLFRAVERSAAPTSPPSSDVAFVALARYHASVTGVELAVC